MLKWLKWFFSKKVKVVVNNNFTEDLHSIRNNKAVVGKPITIVIKTLDGFELDFVRVYIKKANTTTEIECIKEINNIAIIKYTPTEEDKKIEIIASAKMISPKDTIEQATVYEIRCDEFQHTLPKSGGSIFINPYILKSEFTDEGRVESIIDYNPDDFTISINCDKWILKGNEIIAPYNDGDRIECEINIQYGSIEETNQIYQE